MESVTALEAKTRFGQLLERVVQGEEVIITRHEKPVVERQFHRGLVMAKN